MLAHAVPQWPVNHADTWAANPAVQAPARDAGRPVRSIAPDLQAGLVAALDRLSHGVALLDVHGTVRHANVAASTLFGRVASQHEGGKHVPMNADWAAALRHVCLQGRREMLRFDTPRGGVMAVMTPLTVAGETLAFAVLGRDELCGNVELQMFALQFKLTNAETAVLRQLARGLSTRDIATEHRVALTTVVSQIAAIRSKTQCVSVRAVLATLARMPPVRPLLPIA